MIDEDSCFLGGMRVAEYKRILEEILLSFLIRSLVSVAWTFVAELDWLVDRGYNHNNWLGTCSECYPQLKVVKNNEKRRTEYFSVCFSFLSSCFNGKSSIHHGIVVYISLTSWSCRDWYFNSAQRHYKAHTFSLSWAACAAGRCWDGNNRGPNHQPADAFVSWAEAPNFGWSRMLLVYNKYYRSSLHISGPIYANL